MRAVVAGAGVAGLTAAWWLARAGWDVVVLERAPEPRTAGYLIDFYGPGFEVADRMGLVPRLRGVRARIDELTYTDPSGRTRGRADYAAFVRAVDGKVLSLPRGALAGVLLEALPPAVVVRWDAEVVEAASDDDRAHVTLRDGEAVEADLVVGADGLHSRVRQLVAPGAAPVRPLGYHTAAYVVRADDVVAAAARRMVTVVAPGRQVGVYPMGDGTAAVWLVHRTDATLPADPWAAVHAAYAGMGPSVDRLLELCPRGTDLYYDLVAQVEVEPWVRGRAVLVGDACQAPSLMAGQGASMAMTGGWALAHHLAAADDVVGGLDAYAAAMRPFAAERQLRGRATARWLVPERAWRIRARQAFLALSRAPGSGRAVRAAFGAEVAPRLPA